MTAGNFDIQRLDKSFLASHVGNFLETLKGIEHEYWQEKHFLMDLPEKWLHSVMALDDNGEIAAYIIASKKGDANVHIHKFMVSKTYCSQGLGKNLLLFLCDQCAAEKVETLSLKVYKHNPRAISFYEKYEFRRVLTGQDIVEMRGEVNTIRAKTNHNEGVPE